MKYLIIWEQILLIFSNIQQHFSWRELFRESNERLFVEEGIKTQPWKMLSTSFILQTETLITPLLLSYLQLALFVTEKLHFVEYIPENYSSSLVQLAVDARRQGNESPKPSVVSEAMKLLANYSYGYQNMDRSLHTVTKHLSDEKTHAANSSKQIKNCSKTAVDLAKAQCEHKEPIIVRFFFLPYAKLRMLELYYNFSTKFFDVKNFSELKKDTDSLYLALAEKKIENWIWLEMKRVWEQLRSNVLSDRFASDASGNFFPRMLCASTKKHGKRKPILFCEELRHPEMLWLCSKTCCWYDVASNKFKFSSWGLIKRELRGKNGEAMVDWTSTAGS